MNPAILGNMKRHFCYDWGLALAKGANPSRREETRGVNVTNLAVIGTQWGDEGKGKVVDLLARQYDYVVRFQGGHNAGHSVVINGVRFALHVLPSGVFNPNAVNVIGNGVVVEPLALVKEIKGMREKGIAITPQNLKISDRAHLILPYHGVIDRHRDSAPGMVKIGTTGRGIGPAYEWKASRHGVRFCDIGDREALKARLESEMQIIAGRYQNISEIAGMTAASILDEVAEALDMLEPHVADTVALLTRARKDGKTILFEGAQATLLDVDFGTYPFVTSSNSCSVGICAGAGVPAASVGNPVGIFKAYLTRVGEGPFPTELEDETGEALRKAGMEYGTTTGRPRRCGWLDLVALEYACNINGFGTLAMMKLDVLDELSEIKVCTAYEIDGRKVVDFPASGADLAKAVPVYETLPGWQTSVADTRSFEALPAAAKDYIGFIEKHCGVPVGLVSVGPDREQTIIRDQDIFGG